MPDKTPDLAALIQAEPDLVDRIFDYIFSDPDPDPALAVAIEKASVSKIKTMVRAEFKGEMFYVAGRPVTERQKIVAQTLALFDGRNATEVARRLGIGRATVYRYLKQAGGR